MNIADALKILGLEKNASTSQLKSAYKKLALEFHPDRNPGDPEAERRFKQVVIAHEILQNPKRADTRGASRGRKSAQPRNEYEEKWEDIFSHIFRSAREPEDEKNIASQDLHAHVEVTLEELTRDSEKEISVSRRVPLRFMRRKRRRNGRTGGRLPRVQGRRRGSLQPGARRVAHSLLGL